MTGRRQNRGTTAVLAMIFLAIFASLAVSFTAATNISLQKADSTARAQGAQMAAESGLAHAVAALNNLSIDPNAGDEGLLLAAATYLADLLEGTPNLGQGRITCDNGVVRTPPIAFGDQGQSYQLEVASLEAGKLTLTIHGSCRNVTRNVRIQMEPAEQRSAVFDFGLASRSKIIMTGNASIEGVNDPSEANILSATYSDPEAVKLTGNCDIDGDISTCNPDSHVTVTGNCSIGGTSDWDEAQDHIHIGVGDVEFPEVDPTVFEPFATTIVDSTTKTNGNITLENIRIRAGTNPTFSGNTTLRGVVYIEQPNTVTFSGNLDFTGVIVTEDAGENAYADNTIQFTGNMSSAGVEDLPDTAAFDQLRQMPGSMLLAPGFGVKFTGNFHTINGMIAADKFIFTGNAGGTVQGGVICYSDSDFTLTGNSGLRIDRSGCDETPPGFHSTYSLTIDADSYLEL